MPDGRWNFTLGEAQCLRLRARSARCNLPITLVVSRSDSGGSPMARLVSPLIECDADSEESPISEDPLGHLLIRPLGKALVRVES